MPELRNRISKHILKKRLEEESIERVTVSFYKYHRIENPTAFRNLLFKNFSDLNVFGRVYVAHEGINAQASVPVEKFEPFKTFLYSFDFLDGIRLNVAVDDDGKSFWKLIVRVREKIVADGIDDENFDIEQTGKYVTAEEFNKLTQDPKTIIVDVRNYYEYEVGHFENAIEIPSDAFREQLPMALEMLADRKESNVLMYCTGGIRCEKASAFLRHNGFRNVFHLEGGIIDYVRKTRENGLENKFKGKNFVFDSRLGERITDDVLSNCHQCGAPSDSHTNCKNVACHLLFIQCEDCRERFEGCCSDDCKEIVKLPFEEQKKLRRGKPSKSNLFGNSRKRIRPTLREVNPLFAEAKSANNRR